MQRWITQWDNRLKTLRWANNQSLYSIRTIAFKEINRNDCDCAFCLLTKGEGSYFALFYKSSESPSFALTQFCLALNTQCSLQVLAGQLNQNDIKRDFLVIKTKTNSAVWNNFDFKKWQRTSNTFSSLFKKLKSLTKLKNCKLNTELK